MTKTYTTLEKSELRYRRLFESAQDGIAILSFPEGLLEDANPYLINLTGYSLEELQGKKLWELGFITDKKIAQQAFSELVKKNYVRYENIDLLSKNGKTLKVEFVSNVYPVNGDIVIQCNIRDISDRVVAEEAAVALEEQRTEDLYGSITALSNSVEARDPYTAGHQFRTAAIAKRIAREMKLSQETIDGLLVAAKLHDIGKFGIPSDLLNKPYRLNTAEFQLVKAHPQAGYEILKSINFPWDVPRFVLEHHERLDGSGYPNGLTRENISQEAKILAIADTVEAMSSHRPYRPALGVDAALAELEDGKDTRYDAAGVDAAICIFKEHAYNIPQPIRSVFE